MTDGRYDAVVVGAGPNGLAAAITIARRGRSVLVLEAADTPGGGARSAEVTLPGFVSDICSSVHPLGAASPFFRSLPLGDHGLAWALPEVQVAHPLDRGPAGALYASIEATGTALGEDGKAYRRLVGYIAANWHRMAPDLLGSLLRIPRHPFLLARFGASALAPASVLARLRLRTEAARGLLGGISAHATLPLEHPFTASFGMVLASAAHVGGWPFARGGSQAIADALVSYLRSLGGEVACGHRVRSPADIPRARAVLFDVDPHQLEAILGERLPGAYRRQLRRYRHGPGLFKVDYALNGPIPWRDEVCRRAGTVHLAGTLQEIAQSQAEVHHGRHPARPFVIVAQPSVADPTRAPAGKGVAWAYSHVPNGSTVDFTVPLEAQIERFAPGFRDVVAARRTWNNREIEDHNPNYVGGDIAGGALDGLQFFLRPAVSLTPYRLPAEGMYICSASTPPGGGVHGMCGYWAASAALGRELQ